MSCDTHNDTVDSCNFNSARASGQITATKNGNTLEFYGFIGGPGIVITQTSNTVNVGRLPSYGQKSMHMKMGTQPLIHFGPVTYIPTLSDGGFGEYNNGVYVNNAMNTLLNKTCFVSVNINYLGAGIVFRLEDENGNVYIRAENRSFTTKPTTLSTSATINIPAGVRLIPIIGRLGAGTIFLPTSCISFGYY